MDSSQEQLNCRKIGLSTRRYTGVYSTSCVSLFQSKGTEGTRGRNDFNAPQSPSGLGRVKYPEYGSDKAPCSELFIGSSLFE